MNVLPSLTLPNFSQEPNGQRSLPKHTSRPQRGLSPAALPWSPAGAHWSSGLHPLQWPALALSPGWTPQGLAGVLSPLLLLTGAPGWPLDLVDPLRVLGSVDRPCCVQTTQDRACGGGHSPPTHESPVAPCPLLLPDNGFQTRAGQLVSKWRQRWKNDVIW